MPQISSPYREWTGRRIRSLMGSLDISTVQLAARLGVHQRTVEAWLSDLRKPLPSYKDDLRKLEAEAAAK